MSYAQTPEGRRVVSRQAEIVIAAILAEPALRAELARGLVDTDPWLDVHGAAKHLGITPKALRKIAGERRAIPFEQEGPGCKMWFRLSTLDAYRTGCRRR